MSSLLIEGGRAISGKIEVEGNKNAALPLLAACLLTTEECVLTNMPRIGDVGVMAKLLEEIGAEVHGLGTTTVRVRCKEIKTSERERMVGKRGAVCCAVRCSRRTGRAIRGMTAAFWRRGDDRDPHRCARKSWCDRAAYGTAIEAPNKAARRVDV